MAQNVNVSTGTLRMLAKACEQSGENAVRAALQAVIEKQQPGSSSLDNKIVVAFGDVSLTEANFRETIIICGQRMKRHRNGGGWVPVEQDADDYSMPYVAGTAFVGPYATVHGHARVYGHAIVEQYAQVHGCAQVSENAIVRGWAQVMGYAWVHGNAKVYGNAKVFNNAHVFGNAEISGNARVFGGATIHGRARLCDEQDACNVDRDH